MSVQIELPPGSRTNVNTPQSRKVSRRPSIPRCLPGLVTAIAGCKRRSNQDSMLADDSNAKQQRPLPSRQHSSHSHSDATTPTPASAVTALRRESLTLTLNRSISEPHAPGVAGVPAGNGASGIDPPVLSPPSASPSLHPSKRCRVEQVRIMAPPAAAPPATSSAAPTCFLRPPISIAGTVSLPASPCSESSTLQRTLLLQRARTITHDRFAARLEAKGNNNNGESDFLLVDCRPFIAFNVNHIRGAINVNCCDRFNRKRLQQGKATLADLATTKEGKETLKRRNWREVVVYDDCSDSLETLPVSHTLFLVMNALAEDHREPVMLLGGLRDFQVAHREMCADHLMRGGPPPVQSPTSPLILSHPTAPQSPIPELCNRTKDIENHPATQVLPYLYLGNMRDAADSGVLRRLGVKYVLNVTAKPPDYKFEPGIVYKQLEAADNGIQVCRANYIVGNIFGIVHDVTCTFMPITTASPFGDMVVL